MDDRVRAAVLDNAQWCDAVCRSQGLETTWQPGYWAARSRSPAYYPDAITLSSRVTSDTLLELVDDGPGCSIKDSFAELDLTRNGFQELFDARWIFREPASVDDPGPTRWSIVRTTTGLMSWQVASGLTGTFRPALLSSPAVQFLAGRDTEKIVAGAIAHHSGPVVGVSNVFTAGMDVNAVWVGLVAALAQTFPGVSLVGYEHGDDLDAALRAGFSAIGPLRVWQRSNV